MPTRKKGMKSTTKKKTVTKKNARPTKCSEDANEVAEKERLERIQGIRQQLLAQKEQLLQEAEEALHTLPDENAFPDMGDQATAEVDRNFMLRLRGREQRLLKKIDLAIEKMDSGTYGICEICGCEIGIKRLEARPVTTMCIECKTDQEEEEKLLES